MWMLLAAALLFLLSPSPTDACSCYLIHLQRDFCHSSVVIKGMFRSCTKPPPVDYPNSEIPNDEDLLIRCEVDVLEIFKGGEEIRNMQFTTHSQMCTIPMPTLNTEYLITGSNRGNRVDLTFCNYIKKWNEVSEQQIMGLRGPYAQGCSCTIARNNNDYEDNYCVLDQYNELQPEDSDQDQKQMCVPDGPGTCTWKNIEYDSVV
ncbi:metalloproteinase inhibitor 4-like [Lissotriton helveticus]